MSKIIKSPEAEADLIEIWQFIAAAHPTKATELLRQIDRKLKMLAENPNMGRKRDELAPNLRSFILGKYAIFYRSIEPGIEVVRILHGSRDIESLFDRSWEDEF